MGSRNTLTTRGVMHLYQLLTTSRQVTTAVREISRAAYDAALAAAPDTCPLACIAGDRRSGAELLAGLEADRQHAERVVGTAEWAERLDLVAATIGPRIIRAAVGAGR
jgi:hypothetical protein